MDVRIMGVERLRAKSLARTRGRFMNLFDKMRQQKLMSVTLMIFTLSVGILIGTLVNTQVHAAKGQAVAPDATPLTVPKVSEIGSDFTKLAKKLQPSVVNIMVEVPARV